MPVFNPNCSIARLERERLVLIRETGRSLRKTDLCPGEWTGKLLSKCESEVTV